MAQDNTPHFTDEEINNDHILKGMKRDNIPLTRDNYIERNWGKEPEDWNAEHEDALPPQFQSGHEK